MLNKFVTFVFIAILPLSLVNAQDDDYWERIRQKYDKKVTDKSTFDFMPESQDGLIFHHMGLVPFVESTDWYESKIINEEDRQKIIHVLKKNTVFMAMPFLGSPLANQTILDAGCSGGGCALMIHQAFGCNVEGVNLSNEQVIQGNLIAEKKGYAEKVRFFQGNMLDLARPDNFYDFIWACESTEHAPRLEEMFKEWSRVSKIKSRMVILASCAHCPLVKQQVDKHFITQIHTLDEYLHAAETTGWVLKHQLDLTSQMAMYRTIRASSIRMTGSEQIDVEAFAKRKLLYYLFVFENNKSK